MKAAWVVAVVVCVVLTSAAFAQSGMSVRSLGMGNTVTGQANDAGAWFNNPAGLGALNLTAQEGKTWANDAAAGFADTGNETMWGATWSGWQPAKGMGIGAGYFDGDHSKTYGAGFGMAIKNTPLSLGADVSVVDPSAGSSTTYFDLAALYQFAQPEKAPIRVGLVAVDITGEDKTTFDFGVAWPAAPNWLVAVDVNDITDEYETTFDAGAEYVFGAQAEWAARIGETDDGADNNLTLGVGYKFANNWRLDAAWIDGNTDDTLAVSAGFGF